MAMDGQYTEGAIVRIKLVDFMTYDSVEFRPGPHLNVIAAPNGTGKSTLVNGICLGLAGKTKMLGRAAQPTEFIKHGRNRAITEIELYNESGDNLVIRREIARSGGGGNTWSVNGRQCSQKAVEETVARRNIQVGNLCQFLPQDKVADFAKMSSIELLENTEKAVGSAELLENHETLKSARTRAKTIGTQFKNLSDRLETEKSKNTRLEQDVKNYEERQRHLDQVALLQKKRAWLAYEEKRKLYTVHRDKKKEFQQGLQKKKRENAPLEAKLKTAQTKIRQFESDSQKITDVLRQDAELAASKNRKIDALTEKMAEVRDELESKREEENKRKRKICELKKQVATLQNELAGLDSNAEDVQPEIDAVNRQKYDLTQEKTKHMQANEALNSELKQLQRDGQAASSGLRKLNDNMNQKLELIRSKHRPTYDAVLWLRENKHRFKKTIHEPVMMLIDVKDAKYAKYVESSISFNDMKMFVCEDRDDSDLFLKLVRDDQNLPIYVTSIQKLKQLHEYRTEIPIEQLKQYGFVSYVQQLFDCPDAVMRYLCGAWNVHTLPVGSKKTKDMLDVIMRDVPQINNFFSENDRHSISKSRYSSNRMTSRTQLRQPNLLVNSVDKSHVEELTEKLRRCENGVNGLKFQQTQLQGHMQNCEVQINICNNKKRELLKKRDQRSAFVQQINVKQSSLKRLEDDARDIQTEEAKATKKIQDINVQKCGFLTEMMKLTNKCAEHSTGKVKNSLNYALSLRAAGAIETVHQEQLQEIQTLEQKLQDISEVAERAKDEARQLFLAAKQATSTGDEGELAAGFKEAFSSLPETLEDIDALIHEETARADCTFETDKNVVQEFQDRKREIAKMERDYESTKSRLQNYEEDLEKTKKDWIEPLQGLISRINDNFSYFFRELKCAGEVDLEIPEDPDDFEKYGIRIKVKFRDNENLRVLTTHAQSGGEKSVSTVCYMMALQELTRCPFRVVDEINQGMDAHNERKVYEMVLKTACERNSSQYFLLTPKLLPGLEYSMKTTVLCIFNGPRMMSHTDWEFHKFLKRRGRLVD